MFHFDKFTVDFCLRLMATFLIRNAYKPGLTKTLTLVKINIINSFVFIEPF